MPEEHKRGSKQERTKGFRAWLVRWNIREDKVAKNTGTVITLLPSRYSTDTVKRIVEALYAAYALTFDGQANFARRHQPRAEVSFDQKISINENPGLLAVLATEIKVDVDISGINQTISWRDPDTFVPSSDPPRYKKIASGSQHRIGFNYMSYIQSSDSTLPL
jgi:hypothetical protein